MARIARRSLRLRNLPLFSLEESWDLVSSHGKLPLRLFEPRYVELARRIEPPSGTAQFGYVAACDRQKAGKGVLVEGKNIKWMGPKSKGPLVVVACEKQAFRILSLGKEEVGSGRPLYTANVQLIVERDMQRLESSDCAPSASDTIFGKVYVQQGTVGFASYHFDNDEGPYVSYDSDMCKIFPSLDDGSRPPLKKPFKDPKYNPATRTFHATVEWTPATWAGADKWEYTMVFSEDLSTIVSGKVQWFAKGSEAPWADRTSLFGKHLRYKLLPEVARDPADDVRAALLAAGVAPEAVESSLAAAAAESTTVAEASGSESTGNKKK